MIDEPSTEVRLSARFHSACRRLVTGPAGVPCRPKLWSHQLGESAAEMKEVFGGFTLIEYDSLDDALKWAATLPTAHDGKGQPKWAMRRSKPWTN
jgi:hypothetical protein